MTFSKETKWDKGKFQRKPPVTDLDKQAISSYYRGSLQMGKNRDDLLTELSTKYHRSTRQIERYLEEFSQPNQHQKPDEEKPRKVTPREIAESPTSKPLVVPKQINFELSEIKESTREVVIDPGWYPPVSKKIFDPVRGDDYSLLRTDTPFDYAFDIELNASNILIVSIEIRNSEPVVPYKFILLESNFHSADEWDLYDLVRMRRKITRAVYTFPETGGIVSYKDKTAQKKLFCGLRIYFNARPYRFDLQVDDLYKTVKRRGKIVQQYNKKAYNGALRDYFRQPIPFEITVRYLLNKNMSIE